MPAMRDEQNKYYEYLSPTFRSQHPDYHQRSRNESGNVVPIIVLVVAFAIAVAVMI